MAECWELVRSHSVGRFAVNRPRASPLVVPVNYSVEDGPSIVFRSGAGEKLNAATEGIVGIQVDEIDPLHHVGWSVLVEGSARWLDEEQVEVDVQAWAPAFVLHRSGHSDTCDWSADPSDPGRHRQPRLPLSQHAPATPSQNSSRRR